MSIKLAVFLLLVCCCQLMFGQTSTGATYRCVQLRRDSGLMCTSNSAKNNRRPFSHLAAEIRKFFQELFVGDALAILFTDDPPPLPSLLDSAITVKSDELDLIADSGF